MKRPSVQSLIYISIILFVLMFLVFCDYFSLDEPNMLWRLKSGTGWNDCFNQYVSEGRPIFGFFQLGALQIADTLANLKYFRIISVIVSSLFCLLIFYYLQKKGLHTISSFLVAVMVFALPGFSEFISWAQLYLLHLSTILSFIAGILVVEVFAKHLDEKELPKSKENIYIFFAIVLQLVSLFNYQPLALAFVIPAFILLILKPEIPAKKRIKFFLWISFFFILSMGIYYQFFKSVLHSFNVEMISRGDIGGFDPTKKVLWFFSILAEASKLHLLLFKNSLIANIFSMLFIGFLIRDVFKKRFLDLVLLFCFSVLLFFPHLIITESWGAARNFVLISFVFTIYLIVRIFEVLPIPSTRIAAIIGLLFISIMCFNIWEGWVKPMRKDYVVLHEFANNLPDIATDTLIVAYTLPLFDMHEKRSTLKWYADEFNAPLFFRVWPIEPGLKCLYHDTHADVPINKIEKMIRVIMIDTSAFDTTKINKKRFYLNLNYQ